MVEESPAVTGVQKNSIKGSPTKTQSLTKIDTQKVARVKTNIDEMDRVLGGGIVPGSIMLLAGEPGIGKSTLILQVADKLANKQSSVLYFSGEESGSQVARRSQRLGITNEHILYSEETLAENIAATLEKEKPTCAIIDSIQTIQSPVSDAAAGSISQVRAAAAIITTAAKKNNIPVFLIGHVNKEGGVAGPKTLEHLIDALFLIEGERSGETRILRALKNRFGPVDEIGMFMMDEKGMQQVTNPSELLLEERPEASSGSVVTSIIEGTRPILVEVQALVTKTQFGFPQRRASGFDLNRLQIIIAILSKRMKLPLDSYDVFVNVSGGMKIKERAADVAVATAIVSALKDKPVSKKIITFGEIGLGGEIRSIPHFEKRIKEAARLGFTYAIVPKKHSKISTKLNIVELSNIESLIQKLTQK
ncbi:MAG: DNA repair protein RadA [Parcubacteria group bacterium]|nr:DNA repair protein RadA [Parcubacteria group bacterium]